MDEQDYLLQHIAQEAEKKALVKGLTRVAEALEAIGKSVDKLLAWHKEQADRLERLGVRE